MWREWKPKKIAEVSFLAVFSDYSDEKSFGILYVRVVKQDFIEAFCFLFFLFPVSFRFIFSVWYSSLTLDLALKVCVFCGFSLHSEFKLWAKFIAFISCGAVEHFTPMKLNDTASTLDLKREKRTTECEFDWVLMRERKEEDWNRI